MEDIGFLRAAAGRVFLWGVFAFASFPVTFYLFFVRFRVSTSWTWNGLVSVGAWLLLVAVSKWRSDRNFPDQAIADAGEASSLDLVSAHGPQWPAVRVTSMLQEIWWIGFIFVGFPLCLTTLWFLLEERSSFPWQMCWFFMVFLMNLERFLIEIAPLELSIARRLFENRRLMKILNRTGWILLSIGALLMIVDVIGLFLLDAINQRLDAMNRAAHPLWRP